MHGPELHGLLREIHLHHGNAPRPTGIANLPPLHTGGERLCRGLYSGLRVAAARTDGASHKQQRRDNARDGMTKP